MFLLDFGYFVKLLCWLYGYYHALGIIKPVVGHTFLVKRMLAVGRIGHIVFPFTRDTAATHIIQHHKVVLLPMQYGWQGAVLAQLFKRHFECGAAQTYLLQRIAYARYTHALTCEV